jgi:hypothetical protein
MRSFGTLVLRGGTEVQVLPRCKPQSTA